MKLLIVPAVFGISATGALAQMTAPPLLPAPTTMTAPALPANALSIIQVYMLALEGLTQVDSAVSSQGSSASPLLTMSGVTATAPANVSLTTSDGVTPPLPQDMSGTYVAPTANASTASASTSTAANNDLIGVPPAPPGETQTSLPASNASLGDPGNTETIPDHIPNEPASTLYPANTPYPANVPLPDGMTPGDPGFATTGDNSMDSEPMSDFSQSNPITGDMAGDSAGMMTGDP